MTKHTWGRALVVTSLLLFTQCAESDDTRLALRAQEEGINAVDGYIAAENEVLGVEKAALGIGLLPAIKEHENALDKAARDNDDSPDDPENESTKIRTRAAEVAARRTADEVRSTIAVEDENRANAYREALTKRRTARIRLKAALAEMNAHLPVVRNRWSERTRGHYLYVLGFVQRALVRADGTVRSGGVSNIWVLGWDRFKREAQARTASRPWLVVLWVLIASLLVVSVGMWTRSVIRRSQSAGQPARDPVIKQRGAWAEYTRRRRSFSTAFWLNYLGGLAGAHRFYVGLTDSACAQLLLGLGSILAFLALRDPWGAGAVVFLVPLSICALWDWWDTYNLRDMVRECNRRLARRVGLSPEETEQWERAQTE